MKFIIAGICCIIIFTCLKADSIGPRIVGGTTAYNAQFPHQISLRIDNQHTCGGSILNPTTILTAAHCVLPYRSVQNRLTVVAGTNKLSSGGNIYRVKSLMHHNKYDPKTIVNDIAVIKLQTEIQYSTSIQPIRLPISKIADNKKLLLSGWGLTSYPGSSLPNDLQYIELRTINRIKCMVKLWFSGQITNGQICTMPTGRIFAGACKGDSGGALVGEDGVQYGVTSWGVLCARGKPDVFTNVYYYKSWIQQYMS